MGVTESTPDHKLFGFRVYKVTSQGPLAKKGVKAIEDFLIPPEEVYSRKMPFYEWVRKNANKAVTMNIYSLTKRHFYSLDVTPSDDWCEDRNGGFLGACVRYENWATADTALIRVLKVNENSLAMKCGLIAQEDFIVALRPEGEDIITLNKGEVDSLTLFTNILGIYKGKNLELFVFNTKTGAKYVKVPYEENLGCEVAFGKLHEFPRFNNTDSSTSEDIKSYGIEIDKNFNNSDKAQVDTANLPSMPTPDKDNCAESAGKGSILYKYNFN